MELEDHLESVWRRLERASADRNAAMRWVTLATISQDGQPRARTVVLRAAQPSDWCIEVHTDRRSPKMSDLSKTPAAELVALDARHGLQFRLAGVIDIASPQRTEDVWRQLHPGARKPYAAVDAPGTILNRSGPLTEAVASPSSGLAFDIIESDASEPDDAIKNFAVLILQVHRIDWLWLAEEGHQRAYFERGSDGQVTSRWLAP